MLTVATIKSPAQKGASFGDKFKYTEKGHGMMGITYLKLAGTISLGCSPGGGGRTISIYIERKHYFVERYKCEHCTTENVVFFMSKGNVNSPFGGRGEGAIFLLILADFPSSEIRDPFRKTVV